MHAYTQMFFNELITIFLSLPFSAAMLPTLTEKENPANLGLYLRQTRVEGDVLIPYGIDLSDGLGYYVNWKESIDPAEIKKRTVGIPSFEAANILNSNMNCKTLFSPGYVYYRTFALKGNAFDLSLDTDSNRNLNMVPLDSDVQPQAVLSRIRSCCNPSPPCIERCYAVNEVKSASFLITNRRGSIVLMSGRCTYCAIKPCISQCSEGEFATTGAILDEVTSRTFSFND